jgi:hypothetical protein
MVTYFVEGNERWAGSHIRRLSTWMYPPTGVGIDDALLYCKLLH